MSPLESQRTALRAVAGRYAHGSRSAHLRYLLRSHNCSVLGFSAFALFSKVDAVPWY